MKSSTSKKGPDVNVPGAGYPQTDIGKDGIWVKGKYPEGTGTKTESECRGVGVATRGHKFMNRTLPK